MRSINSGFDIGVASANPNHGRELDQMVVKRSLRVSGLGIEVERPRRRPVEISELGSAAIFKEGVIKRGRS